MRTIILITIRLQDRWLGMAMKGKPDSETWGKHVVRLLVTCPALKIVMLLVFKFVHFILIRLYNLISFQNYFEEATKESRSCDLGK
jgi:hypothetical protein